MARRSGDRGLLVPAANAAEAAIIPGVSVFGVEDLEALVGHLTGERTLSPANAAQLRVRWFFDISAYEGGGGGSVTSTPTV